MFRGVINKKILTFPASKFLDVDASKILLLRGFTGRNLSKQQNEENKVKVSYGFLYEQFCFNWKKI